LAQGYAEEIEWQKNVKFENMTAGDLFLEYCWVVISSGMKNQVARLINERFHDGFPNWKAIGHLGKRKGMQELWRTFPTHFDKLKQLTSDEARVNYLETLPWIGGITKYHLAKNLGMDVAKPDRHLIRVAAWYGYNDVQDLCIHLSQATGDRISVVDLIIWRYCNLKGSFKTI